jgi:hypothetical protein
MDDVREHDIWTHKETGNDYAVKEIGSHSETGKRLVILADSTGATIVHPIELFVFRHDLTHRIYTDFI